MNSVISAGAQSQGGMMFMGSGGDSNGSATGKIHQSLYYVTGPGGTKQQDS